MSKINQTNPTRLEPARLHDQEVEYPIVLPIKVVGHHQEDFQAAVNDICADFDHDLEAQDVKLKPSKAGNYLSMTFDFTAQSREQLDRFYRAIEAHPLVKWTL